MQALSPLEPLSVLLGEWDGVSGRARWGFELCPHPGWGRVPFIQHAPAVTDLLARDPLMVAAR